MYEGIHPGNELHVTCVAYRLCDQYRDRVVNRKDMNVMVILYLILLAGHLGVTGLAMSRGTAGRWNTAMVVIAMVASCVLMLSSVYLLQQWA